MTKFVVDTNALLDNPTVVAGEEYLIFPPVLRELENLETRKGDKALQFQVRKAKRFINENPENVHIEQEVDPVKIEAEIVPREVLGSPTYADNQILAYAIRYQYLNEEDVEILTNDVLLEMKAKALGFDVISTRTLDDGSYDGVRDFYYNPEDEEHNEIFSKIETITGTEIGYNPFDMVTNEYLAIWDTSKANVKDGEVKGFVNVGMFRFDGVNLKRVPFQKIKSGHFGEIEPRNIRQNLAIDMLKNPTTTVKAIFGNYGVGL